MKILFETQTQILICVQTVLVQFFVSVVVTVNAVVCYHFVRHRPLLPYCDAKCLR